MASKHGHDKLLTSNMEVLSEKGQRARIEKNLGQRISFVINSRFDIFCLAKSF